MKGSNSINPLVNCETGRCNSFQSHCLAPFFYLAALLGLVYFAPS